MLRKVYDEDLAAGGRLGIFLDSGIVNQYFFKFLSWNLESNFEPFRGDSDLIC